MNAAPAAAIDDAPALLKEVAWRHLAADAEAHTVAVLVSRRLRELGAEPQVPEGLGKRWRADRRHAQLQHRLQERSALAITNAFRATGVRHAFVKGFAYRRSLYQPAWVRLGGDVDVLVDRSNVEMARSTLRELGFTQASCSHDYRRYRPATAEEIRRVEAEHHELAQFVKNHRLDAAPAWLLSPSFKPRVPFAYEWVDDAPTFHSCVDVHWALHFWFAYASPLDELTWDEGVPVLSAEWNVLFSCFKLYFETFDRPRHGFAHLVDLGALMSRPLDWTRFRDLVREHDLAAAVFYTLSAAERLAGQEVVPAGLTEEWSRISRPRRPQADAGDFTPYLVGRRVPGDFLGGCASP